MRRNAAGNDRDQASAGDSGFSPVYYKLLMYNTEQGDPVSQSSQAVMGLRTEWQGRQTG
jgi:hypothetical protein